MVNDEFLSKVEKVKYLRVVNKMPSQGLVEGEWNRRLTGGLLRCLLVAKGALNIKTWVRV